MNGYVWTWDGMFDCWIRMPESMWKAYDSGVRAIHMSPYTSTDEKRDLLFEFTRRMGGEFVPNAFAPHQRPIIVKGPPILLSS